MNLFSSLLSRLSQAFKTNPVSTVLVGLSGIVLVVLLSAFVLVMFCESAEKYLVQILGASEKNETLKFLGIGMGGILLALQALIANRRAKAMEDTAKAQVEANQKTEQGQRQERLKNAIEHLGHESDSVRLGGAYELFHLAEETKEWCQTILDILCAHIRRTTSEAEYRKEHQSKPSEEVQSLLTLLFVQEHEIFQGCNINLQESRLNGADLSGARLERAVLYGVRLQEAHLESARLQGARLRNADLEGAHLDGVHLEGAYLDGANLQRAYLHEADLRGACLTMARLQSALIGDAKLQGTELTRAGLQGAILSNSSLQGAYLWGAELQATNLAGTKLQGTAEAGRPRFDTFAQCIRWSIGKETALPVVIFEGGLSREDVRSITEGWPERDADEFLVRLRPHIRRTVSNELPECSRAITGHYTAEEAEKWIAEYNEAMSEVPGSDN